MSNYFSEVIEIQTRKKVPHEDGRGFTWVNDRIERVEVHLEIDIQALAKTLGMKAFNSKGNKAIEASGLVVARVAR